MPYDPTPEQLAILGHDPTRHARVLAGPGTGKSTTMVALLGQLLEDDDSLRVRMLTFTRAATAELAEKSATHAEQAVHPSTIHSFAISVLLRSLREGTGPGRPPERVPGCMNRYFINFLYWCREKYRKYLGVPLCHEEELHPTLPVKQIEGLSVHGDYC